MAPKRKREEQHDPQDSFPKPAPGTKTYTSGREVKDALSRGGRAAFIAFHQQIVTPHSKLPLPITHQAVLIIQHYLALSPTLEEIFKSWNTAFDLKDQHLTAAVVQLLTAIINVLTPLPYFQTTLATIVSKILSPNEVYASLMNRLVQSTKREQALVGVGLASAAVNVDSALAVKVWASLVEGGSVKALPKLLGMRRRTTGTSTDKDPLDKPDIRHHTVNIVLPLLSHPTFQAHAKALTPPLFSNLSSDPPLTVLRIMTALWNAINGQSASPSANRRTAITLLDESSIEALIRLLSRTGESDLEGGVLVADMAAGFLKGATCVPGRGICFQDAGWYPRRVEGEDEDGGGEGSKKGGLHNKILSNVVRKLGARVIDDGRVGTWVEDVLRACPELVAGYWPHSALSLDPRLHAKWIATISFIGRIVSLPIPPASTFFLNAPQDPSSSSATLTPRPTPPPLLSIVEAVLPAPLTKQHLTKGLQHPNGLVQHLTALALARGLQKLVEVQNMFKEIEAELEVDGPWARRRREVELECRRRVPEVSVIIGFAQRSGTGQSNGPDADETQAAARTALLTESALRLFGLYHKALPSLAAEVRFDVGKLLVSASSAGALAAERRAAREGSVVSDTGSIASVGTLGSVGMGGGFGHTRGDVEGFEALSQVHVLRLLQDVTEWNWANKAAGSPYSYLYHILQLHLSTPHPITKQTTTSLLTSLLQPSILFEHDAAELQIWLAALPMAMPGDTNPVQLLTQRIHLLSFLDDSVRRCLKTPYRYIEDGFALSPETVSNLNPQDASSPLLMTILEQLQAKLLGQHIATEAALAVVMYVRKVVLGLTGKQPSLAFVAAILARLQAIVAATKEAGQARLGLAEAVQSIDSDLESLQSGSQVSPVVSLSVSYSKIIEVAVNDEELEAALAVIPFERIFISITPAQWLDQAAVDRLRRIYFSSGGSQAIAAHIQTVLHRLASLPPSAGTLLTLITSGFAALQVAGYERSEKLKELVFGHSAVVALLLSPSAPETAAALLSLVDTALVSENPQDGLIAEPFTRKCSDALAAVKRKTLPDVATLCLPWLRFFPAKTVAIIFPHVLSVVEKASADKITPNVLAMLAGLTRSLSGADAEAVSSQISTLIRLELFEPISELIRSQLPVGSYATSEKYTIRDVEQRWAQVRGRSFSVSEADVRRAFDNGSVSAQVLLDLLARHPSTRGAIQKLCIDATDAERQGRLLPLIATILEYPVSAEVVQTFVTAVIGVLSAAQSDVEHREYASKCLALLGPSLGTFDDSLAGISKPVFDLAIATAFAKLATRKLGILATAISRHVDAGLQFAVRQLSRDGPVDPNALVVIKQLCITIASSPDAEVSGYFAEPVITAIAQERLESIECLEFASLLCKRGQLKAAFIRQILQLIVASPQLARLSSKTRTLDLPLMRAFTSLLHSLFNASTYVSCQPNFIEPLVGLYRGTLDISDRNVLSVLQLFEQNRKISVASIMRLWSPDPSAASSVTQRSLDVVKALDPQKVFATCTAYPLRRGYSNEDGTFGSDDAGLYDPVVILSVTLAMLHEGNITGLDWVEILRSNVLGLAICALSSRVVEIRSVAGFVLAKSLTVIEATPFQERPQVAQTLRVLRHSVQGSDENGKAARVPSLAALFFAHSLRSIANPAHFLYPVASRFLLQRPKFDMQDVPLLYGMLYAGGEGWKKERGWIVRLIRDGMRSEADWRVLRRRHTFALLASLYQSSTDATFRRSVLQALTAMTACPSACRNLVQREGFIAFLSQQWELSQGPAHTESRAKYLELLENVTIALAAQEAASVGAGKAPKKSKTSWKDQTLGLVRQALGGADVETLSVLSRILLRISSLPSKSDHAQLLKRVLERLQQIERHLRLPISEAAWHATVSNLFESVMCGRQDTVAAAGIGCRMMIVQGPLGDWVRQQTLASQ